MANRNQWVQTVRGTVEFKAGNPGREDNYTVTEAGVKLESSMAKHAVDTYDRVVFMFEPGEEPAWDHHHSQNNDHHHPSDTPASHNISSHEDEDGPEATGDTGAVSEVSSGISGAEGHQDPSDVNDDTGNFKEGAASPGPAREVDLADDPDYLKVACPYCHAEAGQKCVTQSGGFADGPHKDRTTAHLGNQATG